VAEEAGQNRTEAPTPRRLQRAKEAGQLPISSELSVCAALSACILLLIFVAPSSAYKLASELAVLLSHPDLNPVHAFRQVVLKSALDCLPFIILPAVASAIAVGVQTGFAVNPGSLRPNLDRVSPAAGLRRLFAPQNLVETGKAAVKLIAIAAITWNAIASSIPIIAALPLKDLHLLLPALVAAIMRICLTVLALQALVTVFDLLWTRFRFVQSLRMTRQDVKEETKETEGDPLLKSRMRRLRQQRARQRLRASVPKATVVVTNPTEYAVALSYDRARSGAPRVVAKGANLVAARIRELAREHGVPLVANPPLARALYRLELEAEVPPEHYRAVAEIIAYVWRLRASVVSNPSQPSIP